MAGASLQVRIFFSQNFQQDSVHNFSICSKKRSVCANVDGQVFRQFQLKNNSMFLAVALLDCLHSSGRAASFGRFADGEHGTKSSTINQQRVSLQVLLCCVKQIVRNTHQQSSSRLLSSTAEGSVNKQDEVRGCTVEPNCTQSIGTRHCGKCHCVMSNESFEMCVHACNNASYLSNNAEYFENAEI